jgi:nucleoid-associated protein YgaU
MRTLYVLIFTACFGVLPWVQSADESPSAIADAVTLASRVAALEARVSDLEAKAAPKAAAAKPVLEIHTEEWCAPCKVLKADLATAGELPVEIRFVKFSGQVPAFRWVDASGKQVTRTGYARGTLSGIVSDCVASGASGD